MSKKILIYTGKIKSGKTTNLFRWAATKDNVLGILQPVIDGKRFFYSISDKAVIQLEISEEQSRKIDKAQLVKIGKYNFLKSGFEKANEILIRDLSKNFDWIVIDEIGPLELNGRGLEPAASKIFSERRNFNGRIVCVVRSSILKSAVKHYKIESDFEIITTIDEI